MIVRRQALAGLASIAVLAAASPFAFAQTATKPTPAKRIALVIGVQDYEKASGLSILRTPINDVTAIADKLVGSGISTTRLLNPTTAELVRALDEFLIRLQSADVGIVYYAGHGLQATRDGSVALKFFAPVDFRPPDRDPRTMDEAQAFHRAVVENKVIGLGAVQERIRAARKVGLVFWDACRNNPYYTAPIALRGQTGQFASLGSDGLTRSAGRGLSPIGSVALQPPKITGPQGVIIQNSTQPGHLADDGSGDHSPYAAALLKHITSAGVSVDTMLRSVATDVNQTTGGRQMPQVESDLVGGDVVLFPRPSQPVTAAPTQTSAPAPSQKAAAVAPQRNTGNPGAVGDCGGRACKSTGRRSDGSTIIIRTAPEDPY